MSNRQAKFNLALLIALTAAACNDEPLTVGSGDRARPADVQANVTGSPHDHDAIQQIVNTFDQAWTQGDAQTYAGQYAGADWVGPDGTILTDPALITQLYTDIFQFVLPNTTRVSTIRKLTFLTGTLAVLDIDARVTGPLPAFIVPWQPGIVRALEKNILVKRHNEWQIIQHQQVLVAPGVGL